MTFSAMRQTGTEQCCCRYGQDDTEAAGQALHETDTDGVGIHQLQGRQIVYVIEYPETQRAAEKELKICLRS